MTKPFTPESILDEVGGLLDGDGDGDGVVGAGGGPSGASG
jgi:hypothetical protein